MTPEQQRKLDEVHSAIVGNPTLGQKGIIPRIEKLEEYQLKDQAFKYKVAGGIAAGTPVFVLFTTWLKKHFTGE